ncbi:predicted protein [Naegleria gruberi]|uniref:Predicted protein n=1 Tax=Naegleria gruberi TaxID=5762 RepID=D2W001_NAEGR|nr:uncharacterized protein NAEGRDRAFT_74679 [Naegleria gruberi]EFC37658.1 predicted protein [Naegleria gruberi]|eukprot:XP_002670402.1 predicted protein [Naegleria gruberi strain NEG-M]
MTDKLEDNERIRKYLTLFNFLMIFISCIGHAAFWSNASRLQTDPYIIVNNVPGYGCSLSSTTETNTTTMANITNTNSTSPGSIIVDSRDYTSIAFQTMFFDYMRCFFILLAVPATFIWYSYFSIDLQEREYRNSKAGSALLIICLIFGIVWSISSIVLFVLVNGAYNNCKSKDFERITGLSWGLLVLCILNFTTWSLSILLQYKFVSIPKFAKYLSLCTGCKVIICAGCCIPSSFCCLCFKKRRYRLYKKTKDE